MVKPKEKDEAITFHDISIEIKRLEAKEKRQLATIARTRRLIASLYAMRKELPQ